MWTLLLVLVTVGSPVLLQAAPAQGKHGGCSFANVLHVEGNSHYSLTFQQAVELCQSLGYKLATEEQVMEGYKKGLRTCRHGWIDGQNVMFLPHIHAPNCDSSSTEVTLHSEAPEYLSDAYCFNPLNSFDQNCEDLIESDNETSTHGNKETAGGKPNHDIFKEAKTEGFLVDMKEMATHVKSEASPLNDEAISTPEQSVSSDLQKETLIKDHERIENIMRIDPMGAEHSPSANPAEDPIEMDVPHAHLIEQANQNQNHTLTHGESSDTQAHVPGAKEETDIKDTISPDQDLSTGNKDILSKPRLGKNSSSIIPSVLFHDTEGSGSGLGTGILFEDPVTTQFPVRPVTTEGAEKTVEDLSEVEKEDSKQGTNAEAEVPFQPRGRMNSDKLGPPPPTPSSQEGEATPTWLVIFAFCAVVGAILCVFAAIATKDKWYGPRRSKNITSEDPSKDYSKAGTLPLSEKEQEIVTLMSVGNLKNDKTEDITVTCLDEREREYLM